MKFFDFGAFHIGEKKIIFRDRTFSSFYFTYKLYDILYDIHMKVLTDTILMMYQTNHLIEQLRRYFDFIFLSCN